MLSRNTQNSHLECKPFGVYSIRLIQHLLNHFPIRPSQNENCINSSSNCQKFWTETVKKKFKLVKLWIFIFHFSAHFAWKEKVSEFTRWWESWDECATKIVRWVVKTKIYPCDEWEQLLEPRLICSDARQKTVDMILRDHCKNPDGFPYKRHMYILFHFSLKIQTRLINLI